MKNNSKKNKAINKSTAINGINNAIDNETAIYFNHPSYEVNSIYMVYHGHIQDVMVTRLGNSVRYIIDTDYQLFYINEDQPEERVLYCRNNYILEDIALYLQNLSIVEGIINSTPTHMRSPYVSLLTKNLTKTLADKIAPFFGLDPCFSSTYDHDDCVKISNLLNTIIGKIRIDAASPKFQIALTKFLMASDVNHEPDTKGRTDETAHEAK